MQNVRLWMNLKNVKKSIYWYSMEGHNKYCLFFGGLGFILFENVSLISHWYSHFWKSFNNYKTHAWIYTTAVQVICMSVQKWFLEEEKLIIHMTLRNNRWTLEDDEDYSYSLTEFDDPKCLEKADFGGGRSATCSSSGHLCLHHILISFKIFKF